ncbi:MAG: preprotein translocase subunit SecG [Caulobacteraceae bacterium]
MQILVNIILVINVFVCVALIAVVLLQRSEGGALGMGGGGGPSGFLTTRGAGDLLTQVTWVLAGTFFVLALAQTVISGKLHGGAGSIVDHINVQSLDLSTPQPSKPGALAPAPAAPTANSSAPALQAPAPTTQAPAQPAQPSSDPFGVLAAPTTAPAKKN